MDRAPVLQLANLAVMRDWGLPAVKSVTLEVRAGEIVGVAGVSGNGQRELAEAIAGMRRTFDGTIRVGSSEISNRLPTEVIAAGVAFIPEERMTMGVVREFSVAENAILETHGRVPHARPMPGFAENPGMGLGACAGV